MSRTWTIENADIINKKHRFPKLNTHIWTKLELSAVYWVGQKVHVFFCKMRHFSLSLITLLIWIFWACWLSLVWYNIDCSQLMSWFDRYQLQLVYLTVEHRLARNLQHKTSQTSFDTFDQARHFLHKLNKLVGFFKFQLCIYLSWNK